MAYTKRKTRTVTPREDVRRKLTKSTGGTALTYLNKSKLTAPLKTASSKKILRENEIRQATVRALRKKRRATAAGRLKLKQRGEE